MRDRLKVRVSGVLRRITAAMLALAFLWALAPAAPALALAAQGAAGAQDCCSVPPPSCDALRAAAGEHAQTPGFTAAAAGARWRERVVTPPELAVEPVPPDPQSGPPAYLRFQRFLL